MLKRLFGRMSPKKIDPVEKRKRVSCDELSRVLCFEGVQKSERTQSGGSALEGCVKWSLASGSDNERVYESIGFYHSTRQKIKDLCKLAKRVRFGCPQTNLLILTRHRSMSPETKALQRVMQDYFDWHKARIAFISAFILSLTKIAQRQFYETGKRAQWQRQAEV